MNQKSTIRPVFCAFVIVLAALALGAFLSTEVQAVVTELSSALGSVSP